MPPEDTRAFREARSYLQKVHFQGFGVPSDSELSTGYLWAAECVVEQLRGKTEIDLVFFPLCYLLRHALELSLKSAIRYTWKVNGKSTSGEKKVNSTHSLQKLLERLHWELEQIEWLEFSTVTATTEATILEFDEFDPLSDRFRYQESRAEEAYDFEADKPFSFDLDALYEAVRNAEAELGGVVDVIYEGLNYR